MLNYLPQSVGLQTTKIQEQVLSHLIFILYQDALNFSDYNIINKQRSKLQRMSMKLFWYNEILSPRNFPGSLKKITKASDTIAGLQDEIWRRNVPM